jgi:subtilase family serine protease
MKVLSGLKQRIFCATILSGVAMPAFATVPIAVPGDALVAHSDRVLVGRAASAMPVNLAIVLPSRDAAGAAAFAAHVGTRGDALFRHYLTPAEYAARFGADAADYEAVAAWASAQGLAVGERFTARTVLPVSGTAAAMEAAFGVHFNLYRESDGRISYAADRPAALPAEIAAKVSAVLGLASTNHFVPMLKRPPAGTQFSGTGPGGAFSASDLRTIYNVPPQPFPNARQTLAVFEQGGFASNDVTTYLMRNKLPAVRVKPRLVDGYGGGIDNPNVELEAVLDIDMQIAINPAASKVMVYEDGADTFAVSLLDSISAMATDNEAATISISYGTDEALQGGAAITAEAAVFTQLAAQGQAVFVSAGDSGAYGDEAPSLNVSDPASQPLVSGVGGTTMFTGLHQSYLVENVWNELGIGAGATGGGVSNVWAIPGYQSQYGTGIMTQHGGSATYRNVPDVAAVADPVTPVSVYSKLNGGWLGIGGTSVSAPIWAGFYSIVGAASAGLGYGRPGMANPAIYALGVGQGMMYPDYHDVVDGNNGTLSYGQAGFYAGHGYDNTSGYGSFDGADMLVDMALLPTYAQTSPPTAPNGIKAKTVTATSVTLTWTGAAGDRGYVLAGFGGPRAETVVTTLTKGTQATVTGLLPATYYVFNVSADSPGGFTTSVPFAIETSAK